MNRSFDYNGVQIAPSKPVQKLTTVKKVLHIDSADRDSVQYPRNGDFVVYLPRAYERVLSINVKSAEFPPVSTTGYSSDFIKIWDTSAPSTICFDQTGIAVDSSPPYFFLSIDGLNKADETSMAANRSALTDSVFAKFPVPDPSIRSHYNELNNLKEISYFRPPIAKLDRLRLTTRLHGMPSNRYIFWPNQSDGYGSKGPTGDWNYSITLEIETIENSFDDFSGFETRIGERASSGFFGC